LEELLKKMKTKYYNLNMKKILYVLLAITFFSCGNKTKKDNQSNSNENHIDHYLKKAEKAKEIDIYEDALEYNETIIGIQGKIVEVMITTQQAETASEMKKLISRLELEINKSISLLEGIKFIKDDKGFKQAFLNQFNFYKKFAIPVYEEMIYLLDKIENSESFEEQNDLYYQMQELFQEMSAKEEKIDYEIERTQELFAQDNGSLMLEDNPLQKKLDKGDEISNSEIPQIKKDLLLECMSEDLPNSSKETQQAFCECYAEELISEFKYYSDFLMITEEQISKFASRCRYILN